MRTQQAPETWQVLGDATEILVVYNPTKALAEERSAALCADRDGRLEGQGLRATRVPSERTLAGNIDMLRGHMPRGNKRVLAVVSGDGLTSDMLNAAMQVGIEGPVALIPAGNANDLATMAYGRRGVKDPLDVILHTGHVEQLRPLAITVRNQSAAPDGTRRTRAFGYFAIGDSAKKAKALNDEGFRAARDTRGPIGRSMMETRLVMSDISEATPFVVEEGEESHEMIELLFPNGELMAKYVRFGGIALLGEQAGRIEIPSPSLGSVAWGIAKAGVGRFQKFGPATQHSFGVAFDPEKELFFQRDGEFEAVDTGSLFDVRHDTETVSIIAA